MSNPENIFFSAAQTEKEPSAAFLLSEARLLDGSGKFHLKQKEQKMCLTTTFSTKLDSADMPDEKGWKKASCEKGKWLD